MNPLTAFLIEVERIRQAILTPDQAAKAWEAYRSGVTAAEFARGETG